MILRVLTINVPNGMLVPSNAVSFCVPLALEQNDQAKRRRPASTVATEERGEEHQHADHRAPLPDGTAPVWGTKAAIEPKVGDWVLVKVPRKSEKFHSVGLVSNVDEYHDLSVKMLRPIENELFVWPENEILKAFDYSEVVEILNNPKKLKKKGVPLKF